MSGKKDNPHMSIHTCEAYRQGINDRFTAQEKYFEEKFKSLKNVVLAATTTMTLVLVVVQAILTLWR